MTGTTHPPKDAPELRFERPLTTVDLVVFTLREDQLQVLLVQRPDRPKEPFPNDWALPGGFVDVHKDASLQACAQRKLKEKTGVDTPYLEQLGSWGGAARDPRGWSATHVYFTLLPITGVTLQEGGNSQDAQWFPVDSGVQHQTLAFDHAEILRVAVQRLRAKVEYTSLPAHLLPQPFTLPQLQKAYELVLGRAVDKSGFRTRMLAASFLEETGPIDVGAPRLAMGYRMNADQPLAYFPRTFSPRSDH
ncbi:NUDIX domain-containing protein [Hydrogenophaga sp. PAMC20947]|uniref:NUDIX hydrolase n=1 Tax=Hydrogenophaga sp. PAMC20947 TaxID=2565558 RepID=UPI00109E0532|nr:NUDIX domain-containing protein [Hydrogenophaga sp. PAMC20947]QCB44650.1 NUDIX hydrolase [Hydrogenophaga sp. PAMC20947]